LAGYIVKKKDTVVHADGIRNLVPFQVPGILTKRNIHANVSYKESSAKDVANLVNYYTKKAWAGREFHIIRRPDSIAVVRRDTKLLENVKIGDRVAAHNHDGDLVSYEYVTGM
jgi:hypothetical protein